jgi:hypothetical protein
MRTPTAGDHRSVAGSVRYWRATAYPSSALAVAEARRRAGLAPGLQPAAVQAGVLERDRQAQPGAAGGAGPGRVGPPEPVEHQRRTPRAQPDAVVAHARPPRPRRRRPATGRRPVGPRRARRVDDQVAQDPLDRRGSTSATHGLGHGGHETTTSTSARPRAATRRADDGALHEVDEVDGSASSTAAPASNRLISSRSASSASNRSSWFWSSSALRAVAGSKSRGPRTARRRPSGRRERGAQLVRDVGDEALLHARELLELADLLAQAPGHRVERGREPGEVVLAAHLHPLGQVAGGEPGRRLRGQAHRRDDLPGHEPGDRSRGEDEQDAGEQDRRAHQVERGGLLLVSGKR